jgi:signal transduction histidine kinase/ligand-binding sensor domain-containing protein/CheY-like chemotaxis protein
MPTTARQLRNFFCLQNLSKVTLYVCILCWLSSTVAPVFAELGTIIKPQIERQVAPLGTAIKAGKGTSIRLSGKKVKAGNGQRRGLWHNLGVADGLPDPAVVAILQDREGYVWFGTSGGGIVRYDGEEFVVFTSEDGLGNNIISSALQDREGNLWFGAGGGRTLGGGLRRYDGEQWVTYTSEDGLAYNNVLCLFEDSKGHLWFGTANPQENGGALHRYDGEEFISFTTADGLANDYIATIAEDLQGDLWFGTIGGIIRYDGEYFTSIKFPDDLSDGLDMVMDILVDSKGDLWFASYGLIHFDGEQFRRFTTEDGLVNDFVFGLSQDSQDDLWIGTKEGVSRFDGQSFANYTPADGLAHRRVMAIMADREGNMWFGTGAWGPNNIFSGNGVSRYSGRDFKNFISGKDLGPSVLFTLAEDQRGNLWFGGWDGACYYDGDKIQTLDSVREGGIWDILQDRQSYLWFSTFAGTAYRYDGTAVRTFSREDGLPGQSILAMAEDGQGRLWFGTMGGGASRYDGNTFVNFTTEDGLANNRISSIVEDRVGAMWFGTMGGGASRYDGNTFVNFTTEDGLAANHVSYILQDREGLLWFATWGGVSRYDGNTFVNFTTEDGLANNRVNHILEDRQGQLWFSTWGGGASRYDGSVFQSLTTRDGLVNDSVQEALQDRNGAIWFTTDNGVSRFQPQSKPPRVEITQIFAEREYEPHEKIRLTSEQDYLAFEFKGHSFKTRLGQMVYVYRLVGHDEHWRQTRSNRAEYVDLPRGDYIFEVKAVDRDLNYSTAPAQVHVEVHLPYERLAWMSLLLLSLGLISWQGGRIVQRGRILRAAYAELEMTNEDLEQARKSAEIANRAKSEFLANISHEIRTPMNAILGYTQLLQYSDNLTSEDRRDLGAIHHSGDHLLGLINEVLDISKIEAGRLELNSSDFDLNQLVNGLGVIFAQRCKGKKLSWHLKGVTATALPVRGDEAKIRQVLLNLLTNAVKFTESGEISLTLTPLTEDCYRFEVCDSGIGISAVEREKIFEPFHQGATGHQQQGTGLGLAISHKLIELMQGELTVESIPEGGSCFAFAILLAPAQAIPTADPAEPYSRVERLAPGFSPTALVVDDVEENRDILCRILRRLGIETTACDNGQQALESLRNQLPDVVFLDIRMPVLGGLETIAQIKRQKDWRAVKTIAISASVLNHERQEFLHAGFDDFLAKPFRFEHLCQCLATHLEVEYEYARAAPATTAQEQPMDWSDVLLPADLHARLQQAAELHKINQLETVIDELTSLGDAPDRLGRHLKKQIQAYDIETILQLIKTIRHD